jgi:hypothetical protein
MQLSGQFFANGSILLAVPLFVFGVRALKCLWRIRPRGGHPLGQRKARRVSRGRRFGRRTTRASRPGGLISDGALLQYVWRKRCRDCGDRRFAARVGRHWLVSPGGYEECRGALPVNGHIDSRKADVNLRSWCGPETLPQPIPLWCLSGPRWNLSGFMSENLNYLTRIFLVKRTPYAESVGNVGFFRRSEVPGNQGC